MDMDQSNSGLDSMDICEKDPWQGIELRTYQGFSFRLDGKWADEEPEIRVKYDPANLTEVASINRVD